MNCALVRDAFEREETPYTYRDLIAGTLDAERPLVPAPHQVVLDFRRSTCSAIRSTSPRSLVYHAWVTLSATLVGFVLGAAFGILLAVLIVHVRTLEKSLLPWIICSQMVPILAIAPIIIVVLGAIGLRGLLPKSIISAYLCFFPVTIGMVKGLTSPDPIQLDLMRTWSASAGADVLEAALAGVGAVSVRQPQGVGHDLAGRRHRRANCRPAPRPASARGCWPAPITARPCRSGRRCSPPPMLAAILIGIIGVGRARGRRGAWERGHDLARAGHRVLARRARVLSRRWRCRSSTEAGAG